MRVLGGISRQLISLELSMKKISITIPVILKT